MKDFIEQELVYAHPVQKVWEAIATREALSKWLMPCDFEAVVGHSFQFKTKPTPGFNGIVHCKVLELVPLKKLSFSWSGGSIKETVVSFELEDQGSTTLLKFRHSGFTGLLNKLIVRKILSNGWKKELLTIKLPDYLTNE